MIIYHSLTIHAWYIFTIKKRTINVGKYTVRPMDDKFSHFSDPKFGKAFSVSGHLLQPELNWNTEAVQGLEEPILIRWAYRISLVEEIRRDQQLIRWGREGQVGWNPMGFTVRVGCTIQTVVWFSRRISSNSNFWRFDCRILGFCWACWVRIIPLMLEMFLFGTGYPAIHPSLLIALVPFSTRAIFGPRRFFFGDLMQQNRWVQWIKRDWQLFEILP